MHVQLKEKNRTKKGRTLKALNKIIKKSQDVRKPEISKRDKKLEWIDQKYSLPTKNAKSFLAQVQQPVFRI